MWCYRLRIRAAVGALLIVGLSFVVMPTWFGSWRLAAGTGIHPIPLLQWGGPLLLLALLRWRRPEARLLVALSLVPQTVSMHEALALFLVCRSRTETAVLAVLTWIAYFAVAPLKLEHTLPSFVTGGDEFIRQTMAVTAPLHVALLYLPCLIMVLRRPNQGDVPSVLDRVISPFERWLSERFGGLSRRTGLVAG